MKTPSPSIAVAVFAALALLLTPAVTQANPAPLFGETLIINGQPFSCVIVDENNNSDYNTSEDGTYHQATYRGTGGNLGDTVTVRGLIGSSALAEVTGNGLNGYLQSGAYGDLVQTGTTSVPLTVNGRSYDTATATTTTTYVVDLPGGQLNSSIATTFTGAGGSFTVPANGSISGSESGIAINGTPYLNTTVTSSGSLTLANGHGYTSYALNTSYALDGSSQQAVATVTETYGNGPGTPSFTVDANGGVSGAETGFFLNGSWYVNGTVTSASPLTLPNGHVYPTSSHDVSYALDANGAVVATTSIETYHRSGGSFSVDINGVISGSESGFYLNGTWYVNGTSTDSNGYTSTSGNGYTTHSSTTTYALDGNGVPVAAITETYSGGGHSFTIDASGVISGDETGYKVNGSLCVNGTTPRPGGGSMTLFGTTYTGTGGSEWISYMSNGETSSSGSSDDYHSAEGGYATVWSSSGAGGTGTSQGISGCDFYVGSFSSDVNGNLTWETRTGPSFKPGQLWVNGTLMNWQSGALDSGGTISDNYTGTTAQGILTLNVSGQKRNYEADGASATVHINGTSVGTLTKTGGFSLSGWDVQASDPNRTTPLFTGTMLWVNGSEYPFSGGYEDAAGSRTDRYVATGGTLTIAGSTASPTTGTVQVNWNDTAYTGSGSFGGSGTSFDVGELDISTLPPSSGPPALWAAGRFYLRQENTNRYVTTATATTPSYALSLNGPDVAHFTLTGTTAAGALTGAFDATQGGVFLLTQNGSIPVPACPANADGTLRLSAEEPADHLPPAVMVTGAGIWQFLGTVSENGGAVACYGNQAAAHSTQASDGAGCMLKIDAASGAVTLKNYLASTTKAGSYSTTTHLFQTGTSSSLPMPIYGVDPNASNTPWQLASPVDGPASFLVDDDIWRYMGAGANGAALYQGYYGGQQLTLGAAGTGGGRQVTVTDPVHGNTSGLLNDVRAGTRLGNGIMVYSGEMNGARRQSSINNNGLAALTGNLDIPGNVLSLGSLSDNAAAAGLTLQFSDNGTQAMLSTTLGRSNAQWVWWRMNPNDPSARLPVMALDNASAFGLVLYHPDTAQATIQLNPATGTITLNGQPVLTQSAADARYVQAAQVGGSNSAILTQDNADDRYLQKDQPLRVTPVSDILMGEFGNGPLP